MNTMHLTDTIEKSFRLTSEQKSALTRLGLTTNRDLLWYFPSRYFDIRELKHINQLVAGEHATIYGKISSLKIKKGFKTKVTMAEATLEDLTGTIKATWFNQPYIAKMLEEGSMVKLSGKVTESKSGLYLANPEFEKRKELPIDSHDSLFEKEDYGKDQMHQPIYGESRGITSLWIEHAIKKILTSEGFNEIQEYIPEAILKKYSLPTIKTALIWIHSPRKEDDATSAKKRFAFEEVFFIQIKRAQDRKAYEQNKAFEINVDKKDIDDFISRFPFAPTKGQKDAVETILSDFLKPYPMGRLLEGDVGSGKTAVAATAAYAIIRNRPGKQNFGNLQVAYMAPTEILATQHFESFIKYFTHLNINIGLITGSGCRKFPSKVASNANGWTNISRAQLLKWVANGEIPIVIGTHALIQKSVAFKHLALVIIDEQHRFGANQRARLAKKESSNSLVVPHFLSMTATPIPRTLALTVYGDLDISLLDQMPVGRKPIITEIVTPDKREQSYDAIRKEMAEGRQLYVICPRIDEPDPNKQTSLQLKSVTAEAKRLEEKVFPGKTVGVLHSKMTKEKKEEVMKEFSDGHIDILVATSVVEVGVNVPNATLIIIEGAERFGLSQLHQLRGRVIRSNTQAYCYIFADTKTEKTLSRLKALVTAKNGFELAEQDLLLRGSGELTGTKQWGLSDLGMDAIKNIKLVEAARNEAQAMVSKDETLANYPMLKEILESKHLDLHFE